MIDTFVHKGQRNQLAEELHAKGISDENVLNAIRQVPRHLFCGDPALEQHAYVDKAFPIESGQTISQPYTVALQTQLLEIQPTDRVLEIGTGSGYQAAILAVMGAKVYSIERQKELYIKTSRFLQQMKYSVTTFLGDGFNGLPNYSPFSKIIVTAAAPYIPRTLLEQLQIGGLLVAPIMNGNKQILVRIKKISGTNFEQTMHGECAFVPMLEGINYQSSM
ncbi:MAG: protein-L-isoaspartate(D-aspartate) O-methyltransferase [Bacteroidales bacterium]|nr:protein-L-isoaspartate(D-aspartate) O-methyltransferase [Bacteroidales bacterium]MBR4690565.1 protein-L-isoaspartate(D-aspartate) O-methyltransferase [Bacteroidales bacterium]